MSPVSTRAVSAVAYRNEIDGLRAISVLLIIFFHLHIVTFSGGFVGVDVFFVISGFLITNIIIGGLEDGSFSFKQFYVRRIARIVPALLATVVFTLFMAMILLSPKALVHSAQQGLSALFSVSNIFFWMEINYWAPKAQNFLLLHTWSLGVEEQFYLVYPMLLFGFYRLFAMRGMLLFLLVLFGCGIIASNIALRSHAPTAFYLTPFRFYEFALGGIGSLLSGNFLRDRWPDFVASVGSLSGLALIFYSALSFNFFTPFPGTNALVPTVGALLVVLSGSSTAATWLLANPIMSWVGKASYSLYLVHWPIIVMYRYCFGPSLSPADQVILFVLTLMLAAILNSTVELRFRMPSGAQASPSAKQRHTLLWGTGLAIVLSSLIATAAIVGQGWPGRFPDSVQALTVGDMKVSAREKRMFVEARCMPQGEVFCGERREGRDNIMLLADSRGLDIYMALLSAYPGTNVYLSYAMGCAPVFDPNIGTSTHFKGCPGLNKRRLAAALEAPVGDVVFLAMDFNEWRGAFVLDTARRLVGSGKRVYVIGQSSFLQGKAPQDIAIDQIRFSAGPDYVERFVDTKPFRLDEVYGGQFSAVGATYISSRDFFYQGAYRLFTREGDELLSYDGVHLSEAGAQEFGLYLAQRYPLWVDK